MAKYRVIWFDDECNSLNIIREKAYLNDINLVGFNNARDGIEELKKNIRVYDAAVIDGLFFLNADQSGVPSSDKALFNVAMAINDLVSLKVLPWFILSGQTSFTKEKNRYADGLKDNQVYDKLNEEHLASLWEDIKSAADNEKETQIRHKYKPAFDLCTDEYIGFNAAKPLLLLLETVEKVRDEYNTEEKLNAIRKIIEKLFSTFNKIKVLPDAIWKGVGSINNSSRLLAGNHPAYLLQNEIMPPIISRLLKNILDFTQDGSHAEGELNLKVDAFIKQQPTGYLFNSVVFQLMELLAWSKTYFDAHKSLEQNNGIATLKPDLSSTIVEAKIQRDNRGNYHCEDIIITYKHFGEKGYSVGDTIRVLRYGTNSNEKTKHLYPKTALTSEKV